MKSLTNHGDRKEYEDERSSQLQLITRNGDNDGENRSRDVRWYYHKVFSDEFR